MTKDLFDNTEYLRIPPPLYHPNFQDFESFYKEIKGKCYHIDLLKNYCTELNSQGLVPDKLIIGGGFMACNSSLEEIWIVTCFSNSNFIPSVVVQACSAIGGNAKIYKGHLNLFGHEVISDYSNPDHIFNSHRSIRDLQKKHLLQNKFHKVGLVCLDFKEIIS